MMQAKQFWLTPAVCPAVLCLSLVSAASAMPYKSEAWDCPTAQEHYWCYGDQTYDPFPPPEEYNYHNKPMKWSPSGGVANGGYVWTPLGELHSVHDQRAYWPAFMLDQVTHHFGIPDREIDLTGQDAHIQLALKDRGSTTPVNLHGAKVYFFIGHWWTNNPDSPADDTWAFFYNANGSFQVGRQNWTTSTVPVGRGTLDWGVISMSGPGTEYAAPPVSQAHELFVSPQQWGTVIFDPISQLIPAPAGELGFDNWAIVPEPATLGLLSLGGLVLTRRRRTA